MATGSLQMKISAIRAHCEKSVLYHNELYDIYINNIIKKIPIFMIFEVHVQEDRNTYVNSKGIKKEN